MGQGQGSKNIEFTENQSQNTENQHMVETSKFHWQESRYHGKLRIVEPK